MFTLKEGHTFEYQISEQCAWKNVLIGLSCDEILNEENFQPLIDYLMTFKNLMSFKKPIEFNLSFSITSLDVTHLFFRTHYHL